MALGVSHPTAVSGDPRNDSVALTLTAVMLPSWLFGFLLGFSLCIAVNVTLQLLR
jgi:hypothetical protein